MGISLVVFLYAIWSSMFSLAKIALEYSPPIFLTSFRMLLAGAILMGYLALKKRSEFHLKSKQIFSLCVLAVFSIYLTNILEFWALKYLSAAKACFIYSLSPFFAAFFSYLHFNERLNRRKWLGLSIGFLGVVPVICLQTGAEDLLSVTSFLSWPTLAIIGAAICSVYGWVVLRVTVKDQMVSPTMANGFSMCVGGLLALVHSFCVEQWNPIPVASGHVGALTGWVVLMALVSNVFCYNLYGIMLKKYTATFLSFLGILSPVFASIHGWIFLNEVLSPLIFLSTGIVSLGLWIVYSEELKQGYVNSSNALQNP